MRGGTCVYGGPGLDNNKRPKMTLLGANAVPGKVAGKVQRLRVVKQKRTATVAWSAPRKAGQKVQYAYRLRSGKKNWSGWIGLGTSHSVVVGTTHKGQYRVQVATESAAEHGPAVVARFAGR